MTVNEAGALLGYSREKVLALIKTGLKLPKSGKTVKLVASKSGSAYEISEKQLDSFIVKFEKEEPGRYPPVTVRRELLIEAQHRCAVCRHPYPLQFHHIADFGKIKHHDPKYMLAICELDHGKCTRGEIDYASQMNYKALLLKDVSDALAVDAQREQRHKADFKTLLSLFKTIPRKYLDTFFEHASENKLFHEAFLIMLGPANVLQSPIFHLYDKELWRLLREFLAHWNKARNLAHSVFHDRGNNGVATPIVNDFSEAKELNALAECEQALWDAQNAFALLNSYVREQFPELDLDETDEIAWEAYRSQRDAIDKRIAEMWSGKKKPAKKRSVKSKPAKKKAKKTAKNR